MIPRALTPALCESLSDTPVVFLNGARQTGKSTLVQELVRQAGGAGPSAYVSLDDPATLAAARADPDGFLDGFDTALAIDEVQRAPDLARALKRRVDRDRRPGRYLLTGSASVLVVPSISEFLAGRMEIHTLWPFSQGELDGRPETFVDRLFDTRGGAFLDSMTPTDPIAPADLWTRIAVGGFPETRSRVRTERRTAWFDAYVETLLQRDVRDIANIDALAVMPRLLGLLAARTAGLVNFADLSRGLGVPQTTLRRYVGLLQATFLVHLVPAWANAPIHRIVKAPKLHLIDTGLLTSLLGLEAKDLRSRIGGSGSVVESFVFQELSKQASWSATRPRLMHFRTHAGREVDFVLEDRGGRVVGIEVKAAAIARGQDFAGLEALRAAAGDRFVRGVVLHTGTEAIPFAADLTALPIPAMWGSGPES